MYYAYYLKSLRTALIGLVSMSAVAFGQQYVVPIEVTDGLNSLTLELGVDPAGTDGFEVGLDILAPPPPPVGPYDSRLRVGTNDFLKDVRDNTLTEKTYTVLYTPQTVPTLEGPIVLRWDAAALGVLGTWQITDNINGLLFMLDMLSVDSLDVSTAGGLINAGLRILHTPAATGIFDEGDAELLAINGFELRGNYPNPFNGGTTIVFDVAQAADLNLSIYNQLGQKVTELANERFAAGRYELGWNGGFVNNGEAATGVYFAVLSTGSQNQVSRMFYIK